MEVLKYALGVDFFLLKLFFSILTMSQNPLTFVIQFHYPILTNYVCSYTTSKRIELESPGCSGFVANFKIFPTIMFFFKF